MKIILFPNFNKKGTKALLDKALDILSENAECIVSNSDVDECEDMKDADVVITIGGDGTLIKHSKAAATYGIPCVGINTGRLGFLADIDADNMDMLKGIFTKDYTVESRMMLSIEALRDSGCIYKGIALNDAVISSGSVARLTDITLDVSGSEIEYRADGIIISTPTGSTAYSMSAGGPIIDPTVRCITITPICSHSLTARPILSDETSVMTAKIQETSRTNAFLTVDGKCCLEVSGDTRVIIKKSEYDAKFINLTGNSIYKTLSCKF